jgi:hypothetical protein
MNESHKVELFKISLELTKEILADKIAGVPSAVGDPMTFRLMREKGTIATTNSHPIEETDPKLARRNEILAIFDSVFDHIAHKFSLPMNK